MKSQQLSLTSVNKKEDKKIYAKLITRPSVDQQSIYDVLKFKPHLFVRKTKVVPQM